MPVLAPGQTLTQTRPELVVENQLAAGRYRFRLVVTDTDGQDSDPAFLEVTVLQRARPVGPFDRIVDPRPIPRPIPSPIPRPVPRPR